MEPVEATAVFNQLAATVLEHVRDRRFPLLDVTMRLGVGDTLVMQAGVQLLVGVEAQPRHEVAFTHQPDLTFSQPEAGVQANGCTG